MARHRRKKQLKKKRIWEAPSQATPLAPAVAAKDPERIPKPALAKDSPGPSQDSYPWVKPDLLRIVFFGGGAVIILIILAILDHTTTLLNGIFKL
jgi:hypothetical protein